MSLAAASLSAMSALPLAVLTGFFEVSLHSYLSLSALLFAVGFLGVLLRKNTLVIYMCLELMLVASTVALVAFSRYNGVLDGNVFVFFFLTVAAPQGPAEEQAPGGPQGARGGALACLAAELERDRRGSQ